MSGIVSSPALPGINLAFPYDFIGVLANPYPGIFIFNSKEKPLIYSPSEYQEILLRGTNYLYIRRLEY